MKSHNSALTEADHCLHLSMTVWGAYCCLKLEVINIKLNPDYKYWWLASFSLSLSLYRSLIHTHSFPSVAWTLSAPKWNLREIHRQNTVFTDTQRHIKHQMTCVYVKEFAPLEFLLLLLLCLLSGQLGLLNLFFSLLSFLVVLHCLLKRQREIKIWSFKQKIREQNRLYIILNRRNIHQTQGYGCYLQ